MKHLNDSNLLPAVSGREKYQKWTHSYLVVEWGYLPSPLLLNRGHSFHEWALCHQPASHHQQVYCHQRGSCHRWGSYFQHHKTEHSEIHSRVSSIARYQIQTQHLVTVSRITSWEPLQQLPLESNLPIGGALARQQQNVVIRDELGDSTSECRKT